jgi:hypothetical protein
MAIAYLVGVATPYSAGAALSRDANCIVAAFLNEQTSDKLDLRLLDEMESQ